jgi:dTDP-L-rhamnose 4-epimerase
LITVRVLVTGGAGFIGSHTVDALLSKDYQVRVLDALLPPVHVGKALPSYMPREDVEFLYGDVRRRACWEQALEGVEAVFHLAAYQDYLPDFSTFFHTNTVSTAHLYEIIVEKRLPIRKIVVASSQAVYGEGKYACPEDRSHLSLSNGLRCAGYPEPRDDSRMGEGLWDILCPECGRPMVPQWTDEKIVNPQNPYGISKYTQEMIGLNLGRRYQIPTVCLRYSIVNGPRQSFRNAYSGVLRTFTQRLLTSKPPICYEDGGQLRDYVSIHDVVRANVLVLEDDRADFQVFNVGGNRQISVVEYARLIGDRLGSTIEPHVPGVYRFGDARHILSDVTKLKALGWTPTVALEDVVDEYTAWAIEQPDFRDYSEEAEAQMVAVGTIRKAVPSVHSMRADGTDRDSVRLRR